MPYIKPERRTAALDIPQTKGELNYCLTAIVDEYVMRHPSGLSYDAINDVLGALEGAKLEFYRRVAGPYEDSKIAENGDVYFCNKTPGDA